MTDTFTQSQLISPLQASAAMRAIMSDRARLQRMLDFEAALARAEAALGVITASAAVEIIEACQAERYNITSLVEGAVPSGNIAVAAVNALTLEVSRRNMASAGFVHWGASSQDVIDTALMLELRAAIDALLTDLDTAIKGFTSLAGRHRRTMAVARTELQQALPMPFGLKLAGYAAALARSRDRLLRLRREALVLQFGGGAGTLAALGDRGFAVAERLAALLDLPLPDAPWHSHRDRLAEIAAAFAILAGTCGKIARDVALMMQMEVGEVSEPQAPGRGVSSTLPHKRNPSGAAAALSAATSAPNLVATILAAQVQEHERGIGAWQSEWVSFPALALVTSGAIAAVAAIAEGLEIDLDALRANLERSGGRIMAEAVSFALAEKTGRVEAQRLVRELCQRAEKEKRPLKDVLSADLRVKAHLNSVEIETLLIPLTYQGSAQLFLERLVVASQSRAARRLDTRMTESRLPTAPQLYPAPAAETAASAGEPPKPAPPPAPQIAASSEPVPASPVAADAMQPAETPPPAASTEEQPLAAPTPAPALEAAAETPAPTPEAQPAAGGEPPPKAPPPAEEDAPGALMDFLSRAEAEARAAELAADKPKSS